MAQDALDDRPASTSECQDDRCATTPILKSYKVACVSVGSGHAFSHVPQTSVGGSERASNSSVFPLVRKALDTLVFLILLN